MRHAVAVMALVANLALVAASGTSPVLMSHSADTALAILDRGTLAVTGPTTRLVALNGNDPFYTYPNGPFCPNGPVSFGCLISPN